MPAPTYPSNLQRRIHAGGGRVLEQRKSIGVRIHTTPQVGADGKLRRFWVSSKWSHSFPGCRRSRSPLGLAPSPIDTTDAHTATTTHLNFVRV